MALIPFGELRLDRMVRAVEKVRERLIRACQVEKAGDTLPAVIFESPRLANFACLFSHAIALFPAI
jgi:hypothetical protein